MFDVLHFVEDLDLPDGMTARRDCPVCRGFKTFTASNREGFLVWNCYKAGCRLHGGVKTHMTAEDVRAKLAGKQSKEGKLFERPDYIVPIGANRAAQAWLQQWCLDVELMWDVREDRIVFPIYNDGAVVDATGRAVGNRMPKWKRYGNSSVPYVVGDTRQAVVVEDCISAAVVAQEVVGATGIGIMGTSLSLEQKNFLRDRNFSRIVVALDADALPKTIAMAKELQNAASSIKVLKLNNDLKYRDTEDLNRLENMIWN